MTVEQGAAFGQGFASAVFSGFSADSIKHGTIALFDGIAAGLNNMNASFSGSLGRSYLPLIIATGVVTTALPLAYRYIYKRLTANIGKPKMAIEQRRTTLFNSLTGRVDKSSSEPSRKVFLNKETAERIDQIAASTKEFQENKAYFQNVVLAGPPGTGKTMIAKQLAEKSDMDFIMMSSGNLTQFIKRKEHVTELNALLDSAEAGSKPTLIFIDEAEGIAKDRGMLDHEHVELLDTLIARTGTPSKKIMLVLATNRLNELDSAVRDRITHEIEIGNPEYAERVEIISQYAKELFSLSPNYSKIFNQGAVEIMARKTEGLSGRSLFNLVNSLCSQESTSRGRHLSEEMVDTTIARFVAKAQATRSHQMPGKLKEP